MRDTGIPQTAAIVNGELTLPIAASVLSVPTDVSRASGLAAALSPFLEQTQRTGSIKINPYQAFDPIPAAITLTPNLDRWTVQNTQWSSSVTERMTVGAGRLASMSANTQDVLLSSSRQAISTLRPVAVQFSGAGFDAGEALSSLKFDGLAVTPTGVTADDDGNFSGQFTIPNDVPAGAKRLEFLGANGSRGEALFIGEGNLQTDVRRRVTTVVTRLFDPVAQTFRPASAV
uniref:DUF4815 domain-containing protein n=1 Tax=Candidatus Kentrum sp. LPFa TaxID=2126335 RepID=A0A450WSF4_9GAMM|nr:MAG: protein of unknown function (DUF4815) [Candidatus Kentron sp. LPFa]